MRTKGSRKWLAFAAFLGSLLDPATAAAHAILLRSTPAPNAVLTTTNDANVLLEFNSRIDASRSVLLLVGAGGTTRLPPTHEDRPNLLGATTKAPTPGSYLLRWQVLATDGHITRGEIPFTVAPRR